MGEIEAFLSTSDEALISKGYTLEEIEENRDIFYGVSQKTESNLMEELGCSSVEVKLLKSAASITPEYNQKEIVDLVTTSGDISSAKLSYAQVIKEESSTGVSYLVDCIYDWITPYVVILPGWRDEVGIGWAGSFASQYITSNAKYYQHSTSTWSTYGTSGTWRLIAGTPANVAEGFKISQTKSYTTSNGVTMTGVNKSGSIRLRLKRATKVGEYANVKSVFAHQVIALKDEIGISFTVSTSGVGATVSFTVIKGFDESKPASSTVIY